MSLRTRLVDERNNRKFISITRLEELVNVGSVKEFLSCQFPESDLLYRIIPKARKLFTILVFTELEKYLVKLIIDQGITDSVFPVKGPDDILALENFEERRRFLKEQWVVPPVLRSDTHFEFPLGTILPYLKQERISSGSYGLVYKVRVAEGHLHLAKSGYTTSLDIALKKIFVDDKEKLDSVMQEVIALRHGIHPNIIPLLASYTEFAVESSYEITSVNILFPLADMDMEKWLNLHQPPTFLACQSWPEQRWYLYAVMSDLVSALSALHKEVGGLVTSHHDLKPENILVLGEKLVIADLGRSERVHLGRIGGSEVDGTKGLGSKTYQPPEYYKGYDKTRRKETFGRAFDMWAMGCIMVQIAIICVWGWESRQVERFRKEREEYVPGEADQGVRNQIHDDSFVKSTPVVGAWLTQLQEDGSATLQGCLAVATQMLRENPLERIYSWEAELDLYELLHPDEPIKARFKKTADLVQGPPPGKNIEDAESPIHRAARQGNLIRVINLVERGWSPELKDKMGCTPVELAEQKMHTQVRDILLQASKIKSFGWKSVLGGTITSSVIHEIEGRGFRLKQQTPQQSDDGKSYASLVKIVAQKEPLALQIEQVLSRTTPPEAAGQLYQDGSQSQMSNGGAKDTTSQSGDHSQTPLHSASGISEEAVLTILEAAIDVKPLLMAQDRNGCIPLHVAAKAGKLDIVKTLLFACSDRAYRHQMLLQPDHNGITPLKAVWEIGNVDPELLLEECDKP